MANYELNLTATQIEAALNKAHSPSSSVDNTQNLVESGAIKTYVDTQVSAGASITTASFAGSALEDSTDGLTATDTAVPTSAAVKNYVDTSVGSASTVIVASFSGSTSGYAGQSGLLPAATVVSGNATSNGTTIAIPSGTYVYNVSGNFPTLATRQEIFLNNNLRLAENWNDNRIVVGRTGFASMSSLYMTIIGYGSNITISNIVVTLTKVG
jgi:hypothetical protein